MTKRHDELLMYRDALARSISMYNDSLSSSFGFLYGRGTAGYSRGFQQILEVFCGSKNSAGKLYELAETHGKGNYRPYHYFDLDTLYAYEKYLERVVVLWSEEKRSDLTVNGFRKALEKAQDELKVGAGLPSTHYYNSRKPVEIAIRSKEIVRNGVKDEVYEPYPRKSKSNVDFKRMYGVESATVLDKKSPLHAYFDSKHQKSLSEMQRSIYRAIREESDFIYYNDCGTLRELVIDGKKYYVSDRGQGITVIKASGPEGTFYTTRDDWGRKYKGMLYDMEGKPTGEYGGDIFYPNQMTEDIIVDIDKITSMVELRPIEDDDTYEQTSLF